MDSPIKASFIPKKIMVNQPAEPRKPISFFFTLAVITFSLAIIFHAGAWGYKYYLTNGLVTLEDSLNRARGAFEPQTLRDLERTEKRLVAAKEVLSKHVTLIPFFQLLDTETLRTVRFKALNFGRTSDGRIDLKMTGEAANYSAIALQSDAFGETRKINNVVFGDLGLDQTGKVIFSMSATIDPTLVSFKENLPQ